MRIPTELPWTVALFPALLLLLPGSCASTLESSDLTTVPEPVFERAASAAPHRAPVEWSPVVESPSVVGRELPLLTVRGVDELSGPALGFAFENMASEPDPGPWSLTTLTTSSSPLAEFDPSSLRGRVVLLTFFDPDC